MPLIGIGAILALASAIPAIFSGFRGGGGGDEATASGELPQGLLDELQAALSLDRQTGLRKTLLSDPELVDMLDPTALANLGISDATLKQLSQGGVPLQRAVNNTAFGLLPRWGRAMDSQNALLASAPQSRVLPSGEVGPFDNSLQIMRDAAPGNDEILVTACRAIDGRPVFENGRFVRCEDGGGGTTPKGGPIPKPGEQLPPLTPEK